MIYSRSNGERKKFSENLLLFCNKYKANFFMFFLSSFYFHSALLTLGVYCDIPRPHTERLAINNNFSLSSLPPSFLLACSVKIHDIKVFWMNLVNGWK